MHGLEHRGVNSLGVGVCAGGQAQTTADRAPQIGQNVAKQIRRHDDIEALGRGTKFIAAASACCLSVSTSANSRRISSQISSHMT